MSSSDDVNALFKRFGGRPEVYQEIVQEQLGGQASQRWPLLNAVHLDQPQQMPPVVQLNKPAPIFPQSAPVVPSSASAPVAIAPAATAFSLSKPLASAVTAPTVAPASAPIEPKSNFSFPTLPARTEPTQPAVLTSATVHRPVANVLADTPDKGSELSRLFNRLEQGGGEQAPPGMNALFRRLVK